MIYLVQNLSNAPTLWTLDTEMLKRQTVVRGYFGCHDNRFYNHVRKYERQREGDRNWRKILI
jgi:hypothetical protein